MSEHNFKVEKKSAAAGASERKQEVVGSSGVITPAPQFKSRCHHGGTVDTGCYICGFPAHTITPAPQIAFDADGLIIVIGSWYCVVGRECDPGIVTRLDFQWNEPRAITEKGFWFASNIRRLTAEEKSKWVCGIKPARVETGQIADNQSSGGENYDNRLCHCGDLVKDHNSHSGHSPVPWDDEEPIDKDAAFWTEHQRRWMENNCPVKAEKPQVTADCISKASMTDNDTLASARRDELIKRIRQNEYNIVCFKANIKDYRSELKRLGE